MVDRKIYLTLTGLSTLSGCKLLIEMNHGIGTNTPHSGWLIIYFFYGFKNFIKPHMLISVLMLNN